MKKIRSVFQCVVLPLSCVALFGPQNDLSAETVQYTLDPRQSRLTLSSSFGGTFGWGQFTIVDQVPGSLVDCWDGVISADRQSDGSLVFSGGSAIRAQMNINTANQNPDDPSFRPNQADPTPPWRGEDNYGARCALYGNLPIYTAYRDLMIDIPSGSASVTGVPASSMALKFSGGHRDWSVAALGAGESKQAKDWPIPGGVNLSTRPVTVSADGKVLTIPVVFKTKSFDNGIVTFEEVWTGSLVAVAGAPIDSLPAPSLSLAPSGPAGLQFNTGAGAASHYNGLTTAPWVECSWVGAATPEEPATYTFTVAGTSAGVAPGFLSYLWLVANPISYSTEAYSGNANPNVVRLNLESTGAGRVTATLGYRVNAPQDDSAFLGSGFVCGITNTAMAGTWTLKATSDTSFTLIAPNGDQATGSIQAADTALFREKVHLYLGVNPNGAGNLGQSMTVSGAGILITKGARTSLQGKFNGGVKPDKNWTILAEDPASVMALPAKSVYRAEWQDACGAGTGLGVLERNDSLFDALGWTPVKTSPAMLANGNNVVFITEPDALNPIGFFRAVPPGN